jgi:hypothetical protein
MFIPLFVILTFAIYFLVQALRLIYFTFNPNLIRSHCSLYAHPNSSLRYRSFFYRDKEMFNKVEHKDGIFEYFNTLGFI